MHSALRSIALAVLLVTPNSGGARDSNGRSDRGLSALQQWLKFLRWHG
jgi:hypothetical protein